MMNGLLLNAFMALASRLDLFALVDALWAAMAKKIPPNVLERIDALVRHVDDLDLPGEEKFRQVVSALKDPASPVRALVKGLPQRALLVAIQTAYERFKSQ